MKKELFLIATAATMLTACVNTDTFREVNDSNESAIGFSTFSSKQTKADNSNASETDGLYIHHPDFNVWAWKFDVDANNWKAVWGRDNNNKAIGTVSSSDGTSWTASPIKFWDKSAGKYYFYAAAPASTNWILNDGSAADADEDDFYLTYANYVLSGTNAITTATTTFTESFKPSSGTNEDLMIAENNQVERVTYNTQNPPAVTELFDHILSRLNITVKKSTNLNNNVTVDITGFTITTKTLCNKGSFDESKATGTTLKSGTILRWANESPASPSISETYTLGAGATINNLTTTATYIGQYLIIPQAITSEKLDRAKPYLLSDGTTAASYPYFKIEYELNDEPYYAYYNLADAFGITAGSTLPFNEGYQNTLNITIDADAIVFTPLVYKWDNGSTGNLIEVE
jgi:hypothetical protein